MAARTSVPLEPETGTELCRVKLEGGSLGGYRSDILTENLSERENSMLKCLRCKGIMKDASISNTGKQTCVYCKREDENTNPHEFINDTILSLKCVCPLSKRGCEWLGRLEIVENHLTTCGHVYESCQLLCGVVTTRDEMGGHVREECSQREEACLHCSGVHKACEMVEHVKVCGKVFVLCELGCGTRVRRESILLHLESECSEESVVCPYEKYRCEVVGLKRRELKQHLEGNRSLHTELRLITLEEKFENSVKKIEFLERQKESSESKTRIERIALEEKFQESQLNFRKIVRRNELLEKKVELKMKVNEIEILSLKNEIESLIEVQVRHTNKVKWIINEFAKKFQPNLYLLNLRFSDYYVVAGYIFELSHSSDAHDFAICFSPSSGNSYDSLEWPFKAIFITRVVCHRDIKNSLIFKTPLIVLSKQQYRWYHKIASIPLSTDLKEFIKSDSLELEITVRILKNIEF